MTLCPSEYAHLLYTLRKYFHLNTKFIWYYNFLFYYVIGGVREIQNVVLIYEGENNEAMNYSINPTESINIIFIYVYAHVR